MRIAISTMIAVTVVLLAGCNTLRVACAPTFGRVHDISAVDLEAAVAAYRAGQLRNGSQSFVGQIEVVSHDRVRIYVDHAGGSYITMERLHGRWHRGEIRIVIS
jgi:hypothetical protein